jgi:hypothetical protein
MKKLSLPGVAAMMHCRSLQARLVPGVAEILVMYVFFVLIEPHTTWQLGPFLGGSPKKDGEKSFWITGTHRAW